MSQYDIPITTPAGVTCTVGWDNPLRTYFAQIKRAVVVGDADPVLFWIGSREGECPDLASLEQTLAPWATIPDAVRLQLATDRSAATPPTRLQRTMVALLKPQEGR